MLGGLRAVVGDRVISRFQTQKTGALLAYLALAPGKQYPRDQLAAMLWPDGESTAVRNRLNQAVSSLRRQLHPPGSDHNSILVADHSTLASNDQTVDTDVHEFRMYLKRADRTESDEEAAQLLRAAVELYRGEFLHGYSEDWALIERVALSDAYFEALSKLIRLYVAMGRLPDAIEIANRRLAQDPTEERSHRALIRLYAMAGRPRSALAQYAELERTLAQEGDKPSERAKKLREEALAALANEPESEALASGLARTEEVRDAPAFPVVQSGGLPRYLTPFFGREAELGQIRVCISQGVRLISLTGLGGTGKTRLAVEYATASKELAGFIHAQSTMTLENLLERVRSLQGAELLIIDEAEALSADALAGIKQVLAECPTLKAITTSRLPLGMDGEHVIGLGTLPVPVESNLTELASNPSIQLFIDRAQAARQDFQLTERTATPIAELCRRLEGWPLALELAASWARSMTPAQMLGQISQHYDRLASRRRDISPKQRSLRAVIDGSFVRLSPAASDALGRLTVFADSWDHSGASAVCPGVDLHAILAELEENSLVSARQMGRTMRFRMLAPVRGYAEEATGKDRLAEAMSLHAEHFLGRALAFDASGDTDFSILQLDHDNFLVALDYWLSQEAAHEATQLASALGIYWDLAEQFAEGRQWMTRIAALAAQTGDSEYGLYLTRLARLHWHAHDLVQAGSLIVEALERFQRADDLERYLEATLVFAHLKHRQGDYPSAEQMLRENVNLAANLGVHRIEARSWLALGNTLVELSRFEEAQGAYEACLAIGRRLNNAYLTASASGNLGNLFLLLESYEASNAWLLDAQHLMNESGMDSISIDVRVTRARVERLRGNLAESHALLTEAFTLGIESPFTMALAMAEGAYLLESVGDLANAAQILGFVHAILRKTHTAPFGVEGATFEKDRARLEGLMGSPAFEQHCLAGGRLVEADVWHLIRGIQGLALFA